MQSRRVEVNRMTCRGSSSPPSVSPFCFFCLVISSFQRTLTSWLLSLFAGRCTSGSKQACQCENSYLKQTGLLYALKEGAALRFLHKHQLCRHMLLQYTQVLDYCHSDAVNKLFFVPCEFSSTGSCSTACKASESFVNIA